MNYFQLFINHNSLVLEEYNESPAFYYRYLDKKRDIGYFHIILNSFLLSRLAIYSMENGYTVNKISIEENEQVDIKDYNFSPFDNDNYKTTKIYKLLEDSSKYNLKVSYILLEDLKKDIEIKILDNGIIGLESNDLVDTKKSVLELFNSIFNQNVYV
ncbi:hypothetical protein K4Q04_08685 [Staphylococcus epidermidis]|uniref:hypothetical protein n=1 Tax=Staphylococcus epidermidis TaxID=1282 RepID=UPI00193217B3|nr:hypothetical protein [Staphylococcus epidermidis]MBM0775522.1 hypothetical protein [Staphylococcus epidermidis]MCG1077957.1 hypothetical protein [Staphylococcus epidermidis]MCG1150986.1 hypothetical protein [Staphylococcus epidermidis]MCG1152858.1 hypothetical protein [Staphylococcus epidermidis]MCG1245459.1 hypothetical protein [Staphylococcus epidermidis]